MAKEYRRRSQSLLTPRALSRAKAGLEGGHDLGEDTVGKVGGMDEAEGHGRQEPLRLAPLGGALDYGRGVPLREDGDVPQAYQPLAQKVYLRTLAGAVNALHDDEAAGKLAVVGVAAVPEAYGKVCVSVTLHLSPR